MPIIRDWLPFCRAVLLAGTAIAAGGLPARAEDLKIRSPIIEPHELEFENNFTFTQAKQMVHELEYGFTDWLKLGVEAELAADPGQGLHLDSAAVEGFLQLTPQGKYWADVGLFAEYEHTVRQGDPRSLTIGPLFQKEVPLPGVNTLHTLNVLFSKDLGMGSFGPPELSIRTQSRLLLDPHLEPGIEYYGRVSLGEHGEEPQHRLGPVLVGRVGFRELGIGAPGGIKYDAAYLRGLTPQSDRDTFRVRVEFEFPL